MSVPIFILAGGLGTRISEETQFKPKPMVEIAGIPILVHLMRHYYYHGFDDFVICCGYQGKEIKKYFAQYEIIQNSCEIDHRTEIGSPMRPLKHNSHHEKWRVRIIDTGLNSMTGSRVSQAFDIVQGLEAFEDFGLTYGDGLCDVNLQNEYGFHLEHKCIGTVLGVKNIARFGELDVKPGNEVSGFVEKPQSRQGLVNGGFFFFNKKFRDYLATDESLILERDPLIKLAKDGQLRVFENEGFWQSMDTLRDKHRLQQLWDSGNPPWVGKRNNV